MKYKEKGENYIWTYKKQENCPIPCVSDIIGFPTAKKNEHYKFYKNILPLLQRVTSSGEKLLYIDGLRFFAVISVFIFHFIDFYNDHHLGFKNSTVVDDYLQGSMIGVILFFSISGFIIAMPFYNSYVYKYKGFSLKGYFLRRFTRLEPPYIIHLCILFVLMVFVLKTKSFAEAFPHLLASVFYCHEIKYNEMPMLNTVLWTLEIEIQFYILAPVLALIFKLETWTRRIILVLLLIVFIFIKPIHFNCPTVFKFIHYFLIGFLALDVYMSIKSKYGKHIFFDVLCFISIVLLWYSTKEYWTAMLLFVLLTYSSKTFMFIKMLENKFIYTIGGMCYSIYMLHQKLIYFVGGILLPDVIIGNNYLLDFLVRLICTAIIALLVSAVFFILIERPTMKKQWWKYKSVTNLIFN